MSNETIDKFLLKLQEKTGNNQVYFDKYQIGEEIGLLAKIQTDHIVEILAKDGFLRNGVDNYKVKLTEDGNKRLTNNQL
jgi:RPA family protein